MPKPNILMEANEVVNGARQSDYGSPLLNHNRTARLWSDYLGMPITAEQVCMLNILQKVSRSMHAITHDTLVDICGYARNIELIEQELSCEKPSHPFRLSSVSPSGLDAE